MSLREALLIALRALRAHRLRSALTMLGLVIGVAAVVFLSACGLGVSNSVDARIETIANNITVVPQASDLPDGPPARSLTDADAAALQNAPDVATVTPAATATASIATDATTLLSGTVIGTRNMWAQTNNREFKAGSFFDATQDNSASRVVVLGPIVASTLFGDAGAALGQTVRVNHQIFRVLGVMQSVGEPGDNDVVMPLDTARRYIFGGGDKLNQIIVQASQAAAVPTAENDVIRTLSDRHRIQDPAKRDFEVQSLRSRLDTFNQILQLLTLFTASVAAISLFVGAIGVLNIMLVSVTERTREIGIRKAIGATRRAILQQFLIESIVLAGLGGIIGVGVGVGLSVLGAAIAPSFGATVGTFAPAVSIPSVVLSFGISLAIGLVAGGYPANRAARLRPVEALRYE